ncbi:hypothetical protein [Plantibacter sp. CFBP 8804]|uniref:hypothetical protein n=1 Tax=Plantibacter sp. CFBP 8804 TaxID=2775270 RepID=UPI0017857474|nr:hypothetical protein [Plantibacter sp. CFBP 8804]MBD8517070.1 hypothetical protein [Plantibacter sp. CFBP 8804]
MEVKLRDCSVQNCGRTATEIVATNVEGSPYTETVTCPEHALEIRAGAAFIVGEKQELVMGDNLPLELVTYRVKFDPHGLIFTLSLGRGPEVQQVVQFRTGSDFRFGEPGDLFAGPTDES